MRTFKKIVGFVTSVAVLAVIAGAGISAYATYAETPINPTPPPPIRDTRPAADTTVGSRLLDDLEVRHGNAAPRYVRSDWAERWGDADQDCFDTRAEVLAQESRSPVTYASNNPCRVVSGSWVTPWTNTTVRKSRGVQIDHHVAVADAHRSGGYAWSPDQKTSFYNDVNNLNALPSEVNQAKSAHAPDRWRPDTESSWCAYAQQWVLVKTTYRLSVTPAEKSALSQMLSTCD